MTTSPHPLVSTPADRPATSFTPSTAAIRVLVADDQVEARALLVESLDTFGYDVVADVGTGREAIAQTLLLAPDAVLLDVHMPGGVSGIEAATEITAALPGTAVILFTGDGALSLSDEAVAATSAISMLSRPTLPNTLDAALRLAVAQARALRAVRNDAAAAREQLENRKTIERAKGILMRRTGSSEQEAYRILQRTSQDRSVAMIDVARAVLASEPARL